GEAAVHAVTAPGAAGAESGSTLFDLMLLDLGLPKRDGLDVVREVRQRGIAIPILILTARDAVADRVAGLNAGADDYLVKPRRWEIGSILKFMLYLGPVSSLFDFATYALLLGVFHAWADPALFQSGWFVESLLTQTLIIHIIRTGKVPFVQSRASTALVLT
ncbi:response regulator, partial [Escherichia coli]|nr:response regulator [Escherichia coli]